MNYEEAYKSLKLDVDALIYLLTHDLCSIDKVKDRADELSIESKLGYEIGVYESSIASAKQHIEYFEEKRKKHDVV